MTLPVNRQGPWREMWKLRDVRLLLILSVLVWLATVILPSVRVVPLIYGKTATPLHYNIHIGVDTVGPWWRIYLVPMIGLVSILINLGVARSTWDKDELLARVAAAVTLVVQLLLFVAMTFIVYLALSYV